MGNSNEHVQLNLEVQDIELKKQLDKLKNRIVKLTEEVVGKAVQGIVNASAEKLKEEAETYKQLLSQHQSYEEKKLAIQQEYKEKILMAEKYGNNELVELMAKERDGKLNVLAKTELTGTSLWSSLLGNLSNIPIDEIRNKLAEAKIFIASEIKDPKIKKELEGQLKDVESEVGKSIRAIEAMFGNSKGAGFMNLLFGSGDLGEKIKAFETTFKGVDAAADGSKEIAGNTGKAAAAAQTMASKAVAAITVVDMIIRGIYQALNGISDLLGSIAKYQAAIGHKKTSAELNAWANGLNIMNQGVMDTWSKLKSGDAIGSSIKSITWIIDMVTFLVGNGDSKREEQIKNHQKDLKELGYAYKELGRSVKKAIGDVEFEEQLRSIDNLSLQKSELEKMIDEEEKKKKKDDSRISEWKQQAKEINNSIEDTYAAIANTLLQGDFKQWSSTLSDTISSAFIQGKVAAKEFGEAVDKIMLDIVKNQLKRQFLESQVKAFEEALTSHMTNNNYSIAGFDYKHWKLVLLTAGKNYEEALKGFDDFFGNLVTKNEAVKQASLTGAIKGVTEETAGLIAGQMNAIRSSQSTSESIMRNQLEDLGAIRSNTAYLISIYNLLNTASANDMLRAQGLS